MHNSNKADSHYREQEKHILCNQHDMLTMGEWLHLEHQPHLMPTLQLVLCKTRTTAPAIMLRFVLLCHSYQWIHRDVLNARYLEAEDTVLCAVTGRVSMPLKKSLEKIVLVCVVETAERDEIAMELMTDGDQLAPSQHTLGRKEISGGNASLNNSMKTGMASHCLTATV
jgi:hypothetical protein